MEPAEVVVGVAVVAVVAELGAAIVVVVVEFVVVQLAVESGSKVQLEAV